MIASPWAIEGHLASAIINIGFTDIEFNRLTRTSVQIMIATVAPITNIYLRPHTSHY